MYVVNFANNQGCVLVSATRNFLPVLPLVNIKPINNYNNE